MHSPKHRLTLNYRGGIPTGWTKRVRRGERPRWIVSAKECPGGRDADEYFERHFAEFTAPRMEGDAATIRHALNEFVADRESRKLNAGTVRDYEDTSIKILRAVPGSTPLAALTADHARRFTGSLLTLGAQRRLKHARNARAFIKWATARYDIGWKVEHVDLVEKRELRRERKHRPPFSPQQVRRLFKYANDRQRLLLLLGLNLAIGPHEMSTLTADQLRGKAFALPRSKTGIERYAPLWPETRAALPKSGPLFDTPAPHLIRSFRRLCDRACVPPFGLYHLRRTFRTVADDFGDQRAAARVMGRELRDTDAVYVTVIKPERMERLMEHVRHALQIGRAVAARRYDAWVFALAKRIEHRRKGSRATPTKRRGSSGKSRQPDAPAQLPPE